MSHAEQLKSATTDIEEALEVLKAASEGNKNLNLAFKMIESSIARVNSVVKAMESSPSANANQAFHQSAGMLFNLIKDASKSFKDKE